MNWNTSCSIVWSGDECIVPRTNCVLNSWQPWSECACDGNGCYEYRTRKVARHESCGGSGCQGTYESRHCEIPARTLVFLSFKMPFAHLLFNNLTCWNDRVSNICWLFSSAWLFQLMLMPWRGRPSSVKRVFFSETIWEKYYSGYLTHMFFCL